MSSLENDVTMEMDLPLVPSSNTYFSENFSPPPSLKTYYSKIISSCQRADRISSIVTPENKENMNKTVSPFIKRPFNPFNKNLKERLENPIFSPSVFSTVKSPSEDSKEFKWTIDDLSKINPVQIEEEFHFEEQVDEKTESEIQNTIDKYFTKTHMIPSPWDCKLPTSWRSFTEIFDNEKQNVVTNEYINQTVTSSSPYSLSLSRLELISKTPCQNVSTQTALTLPPNLPENINSVLKPYYIDVDPEDINLSMNSLRRKLFFQAEDKPLSPVKYDEIIKLFFSVKEVSPLINNCCLSTPAFENRTDGSPLAVFSPVDVSPISHFDNVTRSNSSYAMQVDVSIHESEHSKMISRNNMKIDQISQNFSEECFKVFESPKLTGVIRKNRKRRRSHSKDVNMSISYSSFTAKHTMKEQIHKMPFCRESVDITHGNFITSQDTGYGSECTDNEKYFRTNNSNYQSLSFEYWKKENKENFIIASTPTK